MELREKPRNAIEFKVYGRYALFSDPINRVGGEKISYQVPTYEAIKGIVESIYWKPTIIWYVDAIRVVKKIQMESKGIRPIKMDKGGNDLSYYTYLRDVEYQVLAHFDWNYNYPELACDRNENKHHNIALRSVKKGGRCDIFLGTRECQGYVELCKFGEGEGFYDDYGMIDFGIQFHGFDYPNEIGKDEFWKRHWRASMNNGIINFPSPNECDPALRTFIRKMLMKTFVKNENFTPIDKDIVLQSLLSEEE